jgi:hypothetical protein
MIFRPRGQFRECSHRGQRHYRGTMSKGRYNMHDRGKNQSRPWRRTASNTFAPDTGMNADCYTCGQKGHLQDNVC